MCCAFIYSGSLIWWTAAVRENPKKAINAMGDFLTKHSKEKKDFTLDIR